jgi:hypothetical protein
MEGPTSVIDRPKLLLANDAPMRPRNALAAGRDIDICAEAFTAEEAIPAVMREQPDMVSASCAASSFSTLSN